jgi:predicted RNA binding protein YcfA (HicA-like mRNA interferase family)
MSLYLTDLKQLAARYGFMLHRVGKHYIWRHPSGGMVVTPRSLSDSGRGMRNIEAQMRRVAP